MGTSLSEKYKKAVKKILKLEIQNALLERMQVTNNNLIVKRDAIIGELKLKLEAKI